MSEHGSAHDISDSVDVWDIGLQVVIDLNLTALIHGDTSLIQAESFGVRFAPHTDQTIIPCKLYFLTFFIQCRYSHLITICSDPLYLMRQEEFNALFLEHFGEFFTLGTIHSRNDAVHILDHRNFCPESAVNLTQL